MSRRTNGMLSPDSRFDSDQLERDIKTQKYLAHTEAKYNEELQELHELISKLKSQVTKLKEENEILNRFSPANTISIKELPEWFGDTDEKKLKKALSYLKRLNIIITK